MSSTHLPHTYGPWAIIAGASEGLGAAFAQALARRGFNLVLVARRADVLAATTRDLEQTHGVTVRPIAADLAHPETVNRILAETADLDPGLVVYNAAYAPIGAVADVDPHKLNTVVDVNVRAVLTLVRGLLPRLRARVAESPGGQPAPGTAPPTPAGSPTPGSTPTPGRRSGIILMSSLSGTQGSPRLAAYSASKSFICILAQSLWYELKTDGVDVTTCVAGAIRTPGYMAAAGSPHAAAATAGAAGNAGGTGNAGAAGNTRAPRAAPGTMDANQVAEAALRALGRKPVVVPGLVNKVARFLMGRLLPVKVAVRMMAASTRNLE